MAKEDDLENLRLCLENYRTDQLYIREVASKGGSVKVNHIFNGEKLGFRKDSSGLSLIIDEEDIFCFPLKNYNKGFSLAYERHDAEGHMIHLSRGVDPYDSNLPNPSSSILRNVIDEHLLEIYFEGRVNLRKEKGVWLVDKPGNRSERILLQQQEYHGEDS